MDPAGSGEQSCDADVVTTPGVAAAVQADGVREWRRVDSVADDAALAPGLNAIGLTYDFARDPQHAP